MQKFINHHTAISVIDIDRSVAFYEYFGYQKVFIWEASDDSLTIVHLKNPQEHCLEIVCYSDPTTVPPPGVGNELDHVGVKHIAFHVDDLEAVRDDILDRDLGEVTEITRGRTLMDLFFVRDPDGLWVEVLTDDRTLRSDDPLTIREAPRLLEGE